MKIKIIIAFIAITSLMSCNTNDKVANESEEHEEHSGEGIVILNKNQREALNLKLGTFQMRNLSTVVKTNGQLEVPPSGSADITAVIGGNVKEIKVFHGDKVSKGQTLVILQHPDYIVLQEEFSEIANKLVYLKQEFERQKELYENNIGAGRDFQKTKAEYNTAKAKYEGLKLRLDLLNLSPDKVMKGHISNSITIKSPINGYVNEVNIKVGSYVDAKDILFEITDNTSIHADFMIYEKDVHLIKEGQKVHFTVSNRPNEEFMATVFAIGKEFESNTRAVHAHAKINETVSGLIPGMYITGHLHTDENYTLALPNDAIVTEGTKSFIFVLDNESLEEHGHAEADEHDHDAEENHEEEANHDNDEEGHDHEINTNNENMGFRMVEIITGLKDDGYTEVKLIDSLPENTKVVMNVAYYLLSDLKKDEAGHDD